MKRYTTFKAEFGGLLKMLGPFMFLAAIFWAALFSDASWEVFFNKTLPFWMKAMAIAWVVLALYFALTRKFTGEYPTVNDDGSGDAGINPTTGSAMPGDGTGGIDMGGNLFGHPPGE